MTQEHRAADILGLLSQMGESLSNLATGEEATIRSVLGMVTSAMPTAHVMLLERRDGTFRTVSSAGLGDREDEALSLDRATGFLASAMESGQAVFARDIERDARYSKSELLVAGVPVRSVACVPVGRNGQMLGALYVATTPEGQPLGTSDVKLLSGIAGLLADVLLRSRQYSEMQRLATIDALTGLLNRSQMDVVLKTEAERANRYKFSLALVMMDLDHFKRINDTHGHAMGDEVLRAFGSILRSGTRRVDYLIRYGGEEFLALLPHIPKENAKIYAERIRRTTSETLHQAAGLPEPVTISIGISALPADGQTPQGALEAADRALYQAKEAGRDRVVLCT